MFLDFNYKFQDFTMIQRKKDTLKSPKTIPAKSLHYVSVMAGKMCQETILQE